MKQLKLGKMTTEELADWFGVTKKSYTNNREKYLEKLQLFANFEPIHGGVSITEIIYPEYDKLYKQKDDELVFKEIEYCVEKQEGLASIAGIGRKLAQTNEEYQNLSVSQCEKRISHATKRQFGEYCEDLFYDLYAGPKGKRERVWAIKLSNLNEYRMLTDQEREIWYQLLENWNKKKKGKDIEDEVSAIQKLAKGELTAQQFVAEWVARNGASFYSSVVDAFRTKTGKQIVFIAKYEIGNFQGTHFKGAKEADFCWPEE